ncbi:MAG TPA: 50S ribosomal protein L11 methyltransferase [Desulfobacteria bacterium]|nr:50S ribosomal protein L11 methyltransferase [Desulfobacteria bacterium]
MVSRPFVDLYIYLLNGTVTPLDEASLGETFIGNWVEEKSAFLFFSAPAEKEMAGLLEKRGELRLEDNFHFTYEDWQGGGLDTLEIGPFMVIPPWLGSPSDTDRIKILLDPGVVFGNCLHPTTRSCLEALSLMADQSPLGYVLDLGTGTGILAIAAALLGAETVLAVDFNPLCVKTAARNFEINGLAKRVKAVQGKAEDFAKESADLVVANIQHEVIRDFLSRNNAAGAQTLIISGQMRSQSRDLKMQLKSLGYGTLWEWDHDMTWFTVLAKNLSAQNP